MNVRHICLLVLTLQGGNACLIEAEDIICTGTEGGEITVVCPFTFSGWKRIFCKDECKDGDVLLETEEDRAQRGRYSIYHDERNIFKSALLNVSITNLSKSDSGWYRCGLVRSLPFTSSYSDFEIRVEDAPVPPKPNRTPRPPSVTSASTQTTTQTPDSTSGSSTATSASPETSSLSQQPQTTAAAATAAGPGSINQINKLVFFVRLTLVVVFIVSSAAVLIFCRRRTSKHSEPAVETEYVNASELNRSSQNREKERRSRSPAAEMSTVYTF